MNYICTWFCADEPGEESHFPQTGMLSSTQDHQDIYWRCLLVLFITSKRFNKNEKHILFTNVKRLPVVDGRRMSAVLADLEVQVVLTDFKYKTPKGYYGSFQNQFYEFSILEHIAKNNFHPNDQFMVLDSDCIFIKPAADMFREAAPGGFLSFDDPVAPDYVINGLNRLDLKELYEELLQQKLSDIPAYHLGEFLLCSVKNIVKIYHDFAELWPQLLERHYSGRKKFNEEAHTLSYLYYRNGLRPNRFNTFMKRIWTNPLFYRNVKPSDVNLALWHLPAEKTFGLFRLYDAFMNQLPDYGFQLNDNKFIGLAQKTLGVPNLSIRMRVEYYTVSYYRAITKRLNNFPLKVKQTG